MSLATLLTTPEFYDTFGLGVFTFILFIGVQIAKGKKMPPWVGLALLAIGVSGILVDGFLVFRKFVF